MSLYEEIDDGPCCTHCGGEGVTECDDPIQCLNPACNGEFCTCGACGGSGLAKDQRVW